MGNKEDITRLDNKIDSLMRDIHEIQKVKRNSIQDHDIIKKMMKEIAEFQRQIRMHEELEWHEARKARTEEQNKRNAQFKKDRDRREKQMQEWVDQMRETIEETKKESRFKSQMRSESRKRQKKIDEEWEEMQKEERKEIERERTRDRRRQKRRDVADAKMDRIVEERLKEERRLEKEEEAREERRQKDEDSDRKYRRFEQREDTRRRSQHDREEKQEVEREQRIREDRDKRDRHDREEYEKNRWKLERDQYQRDARRDREGTGDGGTRVQEQLAERENELAQREDELRRVEEQHNRRIEDLERQIEQGRTERNSDLDEIRTELEREREERARIEQERDSTHTRLEEAERERDAEAQERQRVKDELDKAELDNLKDEQEKNKQLAKKETYKADIEKRTWRQKYGGSNALLWAALFIHVLKFGLGFNYGVTWLLDVLFAFILYVFIFTRDDKQSDKDLWIKVLVVLFLETILPIVIGYNKAIADNKFIRYYFMNRLLTPWWLYFAIMWNRDGTKTAKWFKWIVVCFWFGVILTIPAIGFSDIPVVEYLQVEQTNIAVDLFIRSFDFWVKEVPSLIGNAFMSIFGGIQRQIDYATGGYYSGRVEENQDVKLGVYLDKVRPLQPEFFRNQYIGVGGYLRVESLDDSVKVKLSCYSGKRDKDGEIPEEQKAYKVTPDYDGTSYLYNLESQPFDCTFYPLTVDRGSTTISVAAEFSFETLGYVKTYFMERETIQALNKQGKDPLEHYSIDDKEPEARYTNGPIMMGLDIGEPPVGLSEDFPITPRFSITLDSNAQLGWEGKIKQLKDLSLFLPENMAIKDCGHAFIPFEDTGKSCVDEHKVYRTRQFRECLKDNDLLKDEFINKPETIEEIGKVDECLATACEEEMTGYRRYDLAESEMWQFKNLEKYVTMWCTVDVSDIDGIMDGKPITTHFFAAKARYDYQLEEKTKVEVKSSTTDNVYRDIQVITTGSKGTLGRIFNNYRDLITQEVERYKIYEYFEGDEDEQKNQAECLVGSIIATESSGIPYAKGDVDKGGSYGLMQILHTTANDVVEKIKGNKEPNVLDHEGIDLDSINEYGNFYDAVIPKHNLAVGVYYLAEQLKIAKERTSEGNKSEVWKYAIVQYNAGPGCRAKNVLYSCLADKDAEGCNYGKFDNCRYKISNKDYPTKVLSYYDMCMKNGFSIDDIAKPLEETRTDASVARAPINLEDYFSEYILFWQTEPSERVPVKTLDVTHDFNQLNVTIVPKSINGLNGDELDLEITVRFGKHIIMDKQRLVFEKKTVNAQEVISQTGSFIQIGDDFRFFHKNFPHITFVVSDDLKELSWEYDSGFVVNTETMIRNKKIGTDANNFEKYYYSLLENRGKKYFTNFYDGDDIDIFIEEEEGKYIKLCEIPWGQHSVYQTNVEECPGMVIRNIETYMGEKPWPTDALISIAGKGEDEEHYAKVQIQYDPGFVAHCCEVNEYECGSVEKKTCVAAATDGSVQPEQ